MEYKTIPFSQEAEEALIGCLLKYPRLFNNMHDFNPESFFFDGNAELYYLLRESYIDGSSKEIILENIVKDEILSYHMIGSYFDKLEKNSCDLDSALAYAEIINDIYKLRKMMMKDMDSEENIDELSDLDKDKDELSNLLIKVKQIVKKIEDREYK